MSGKAKDILQMDLYALLGINSTATTKEIKKAYRQKCLSMFILFHLSQALEVLTDAAAKAAYDKICAAKKQAEERNRKLDDKRKKIKLDLEARERHAESQSQEEVQNTRTLEEEIARLREEGSRQLEEEQRLIREQIQREREAQQQPTGDILTYVGLSSLSSFLIQLKWKCKKDDETNGGYSEDILFRLLQKYGDVLNVIVSSKKKGSAMVEFATVRAAELAVKNETGLSDNLLKISWLEGQPEVLSRVTRCVSLFLCHLQGLLTNERDYESVVMMRMRQAAERQRIIEQMQREDEEDAARS
uniref:Uncharacterized protein n=1 Tax=Mola mola TaxID=94237 RepID=A0A3Q4AES9_MOLML